MNIFTEFEPAILIVPIAIIVAATAAGWLTRMVLRKYKPTGTPSGGKGAIQLMVWGVASHAILWGLMIGLILAVNYVPLSEAAADHIGKALFVALIGLITFTAASISGELIMISATGVEGNATTTIFKVLIKIGVWGVGSAVMLNQLGISIAPILTALGVGGLAVALALQDTLSNLFAGIQVILAKQVSIGDYIKLDSSEEGFVEDINWRNTTIRAVTNNRIIVPNSKLAASILTNYNMPQREMAVYLDFGVSYKSDLRQVEEVTMDVAHEMMQSVQGCVNNFEPRFRILAFADSSINGTVMMRVVDVTSQWELKTKFIQRLHERYREVGIEIPFPQRVVTMLKEEENEEDKSKEE